MLSETASTGGSVPNGPTGIFEKYSSNMTPHPLRMLVSRGVLELNVPGKPSHTVHTVTRHKDLQGPPSVYGIVRATYLKWVFSISRIQLWNSFCKMKLVICRISR